MFRISKLLFISIVLLNVISARSQDVEKVLSRQNKQFHYAVDENTFQIECRNLNFKIKPDISKFYSWYSNNQRIFITQGTYSGRLLHGSFRQYDAKGNLVQEGIYKNGLKHGQWLFLMEDGNLINKQQWKNGQLNGWSMNFSNGKLTEKLHYQDDLLDGNCYYYSDVVCKDKYKHGLLLEKRKSWKDIFHLKKNKDL